MTEDDMLKMAREVCYQSAVTKGERYTAGRLKNLRELYDTGFWDAQPDMKSALAAIRIMHERGEKLAGALEPFAKAAMGIAVHDPDFPADGAALRASFDWYDRIQDEPLKRHSVRKRDIDKAQAALTEWRKG